MSSALTVSLNRDRLHDIAAAPTYTADEAFYVELENHGEAVHIHLHLDDTLSTVAQLAGGNHYVEAGSTEVVRIDVDAARLTTPVSGTLKIVTGYGAEQAFVDVTVEPFEEQKHRVHVDESLGKPRRNRDPEEETPSLTDRIEGVVTASGLLFTAFALFAVVLAVGIAVVIDSTAIFIGVGIVIGGVVAALAMQLL